MLDEVGPKLKTGKQMLSESIRADAREGDIGTELGEIAKAHPDASFGSYPFFDDASGPNTNVVIRSRDPDKLAAAKGRGRGHADERQGEAQGVLKFQRACDSALPRARATCAGMWMLLVRMIAGVAALASASIACAADWSVLKEPGTIALIRHADAPGVGDPEGWRLDDCSTQRNLSERGRRQARALGEAFRANAVAVEKIIASQWCRAVETATLMQLGPVDQQSAFNNAYVLVRETRRIDARGA